MFSAANTYYSCVDLYENHFKVRPHWPPPFSLLCLTTICPFLAAADAASKHSRRLTIGNGSSCPYGVQLHTETVRERKDLRVYLWPTVSVAHINVRLALLWSHNCSVQTSPTHTWTHIYRRRAHIHRAYTEAHLGSSHMYTHTRT